MQLDGAAAPHDLAGVPQPPADALRRAAERYGTPVFVLDEAAVEAAAAVVEAAFPAPWLLHYSLKANDLPAVVGLLGRRDWGANVVSVGEWAQARSAGLDAGRVSFEGIGKTDQQLADVVAAAAAGRPLRWLVVESEDEVAALAALARVAGLGRDGRPPLDVLLRLNPGVEPETAAGLAVGSNSSKFGLTEAEITGLVADGMLGRPGLRWRGVHVHVGSQLSSVAAWSTAGVRAAATCDWLRRRGAVADTVDFGGGFPAPSTSQPGPADFRRGLQQALEQAGVNLPARRAIEPGRYLVAAAGWLVTRVLHSRPERGGRPQVVLDAGMTELIRPALYGARHPITALGGPDPAAVGEPTGVEGPVCESTDSFGVYPLPSLRRGDLVAIGEAGAYASSFSSRFNGRPAPPEIMLAADGTLTPAHRAPLPLARPAPADDPVAP